MSDSDQQPDHYEDEHNIDNQDNREDYEEQQNNQYERQNQDGSSDLYDHNEEEDQDDDDNIDINTDRIFERPQKALLLQLQREHSNVDIKLRVADESLLRIKNKRENIGVELYTKQQQLAKSQMILESNIDHYQAITDFRVESDKRLQNAHVYWKEKREEVQNMEKKIEISQRELEILMITIKQVDDYNKKVQSEIQITKRIAYAAEDDIKSTEVKKSDQDILVNHLNEQLKLLTNKIQLYNAQISAQEQETRAAAEMLKEAQHEMNLIISEKKEYSQKWKSSLIAISKRDEAMQAAEKDLEQLGEQIQSIRLEIKGIQAQTRKEQENNERLTNILVKLQSESSYVELQTSKSLARQKAIHNDRALIRASIERDSAELVQNKHTQLQVENEVNSLDRVIERLARERREIGEKIFNANNETITAEKGASNVDKETNIIHRRIKEGEEKTAEIKNETARIKVDSLHTVAHNKELKKTLDDCEKERKEKESLVEKYESEIRSRHDEIEKKQIQIDRLNRKYDALVSNFEDENTGPLEATIHNLGKEITQQVRQAAELQRIWIRSQTELVDKQGQLEVLEAKVRELNSQEGIYIQQRARMRTQVIAEQEEKAEIVAQVRVLRNDQTRLNELIAKNSKLQEDINNDLFVIETDFSEKLKNLGNVSIATDTQIAEVKAEKKNLLDEIVETERQVLLWEKKISLEKETQDAVDPEFGNSEVASMKKEIHRMKLRLSQLIRKQEVMMEEMERAIEKKEDIENRGSTTKNNNVTAANLKQKTLALKSQVKSVHSENRSVESDILRQEQDNKLLASQIEELQNLYNRSEDEKIDLSQAIEESSVKKQLLFEKLQLIQKRVKRLDSVIEGKFVLDYSPEESHELYQSALSRQEKLKYVFENLRGQLPQHSKFFNQLLNFTEN